MFIIKIKDHLKENKDIRIKGKVYADPDVETGE